MYEKFENIVTVVKDKLSFLVVKCTKIGCLENFEIETFLILTDCCILIKDIILCFLNLCLLLERHELNEIKEYLQK